MGAYDPRTGERIAADPTAAKQTDRGSLVSPDRKQVIE